MKTDRLTPNAADYELLARTVLLGRGEDPDKIETMMRGEKLWAWETLGINEDNGCVIQTNDTLDDFRTGSPNWNEPGTMREINGGLNRRRCQGRKGDWHCELTVVDCGDFRLCYRA